MVPPLTPSLPAAYMNVFGHQFAIALQSANLVNGAVNSATNLETAKQNLIDAFVSEAYDVDALAGRIDGETGWAYVGVDLSPQPSKDASIGESLEFMSEHQVGSQEAIAAAKAMSGAIQGVSIKQTGFGAVSCPFWKTAAWHNAGAKATSTSILSSIIFPRIDRTRRCPLPGESPPANSN